MSTITMDPVVEYQVRFRQAGASDLVWFCWQVETLVSKNRCTYVDADPFRKRVGEFGGRNFMFAPPPKVLDFAELMQGIELNGKTGKSSLQSRYHKDLDEGIPTTSSILVDIDEGVDRLVKPSISRANIIAEGRHAFNTWRGIVFFTLFPWSLKGRHGSYFVDSRYGNYDVTGLCLNVDGVPELGAPTEAVFMNGWWTPSCGSVVMP